MLGRNGTSPTLPTGFVIIAGLLTAIVTGDLYGYPGMAEIPTMLVPYTTGLFSLFPVHSPEVIFAEGPEVRRTIRRTDSFGHVYADV